MENRQLELDKKPPTSFSSTSLRRNSETCCRPSFLMSTRRNSIPGTLVFKGMVSAIVDRIVTGFIAWDARKPFKGIMRSYPPSNLNLLPVTLIKSHFSSLRLPIKVQIRAIEKVSRVYLYHSQKLSSQLKRKSTL